MTYSNNPLNLPFYPIFSRYKGFLGNNQGYCSFTCLSLGVRAACVYFMSFLRKQNIYALDSVLRNISSSYDEFKKLLLFVCIKTGFYSDYPLIDVSDYAKMVSAVWDFFNPGDPYNSYFYILEIIRFERIRLYPIKYGSITRV